MDTKELETLDPLYYLISNPFPEVYEQLLCLADIEGEVVFLAPHRQVSDLLIGCLIAVSDQVYHCCLQQT